MYDWKTEIRSYSQTAGYGMDDYDSYFLNLETSGQESVAIPFLEWRATYSRRPWWQHFRYSRRPSSHFAYHHWPSPRVASFSQSSLPEYHLVPEGTPTQPGLDVLNYIQITSDNDPHEFFHLILPNFDRYNQTFIDFNQTFIDLNTQYRDEVKIEDLLAEVVLPGTSYSVEEGDFDVICVLYYQSNSQGCSSPVPVPEGSSVVGIVAIGLALVGMAIRRSFFQRA
ncbi:hypothetical protein PJF56_20905 [Roseofilum sp. BLCC_M91]|uniref:PEP-CTERM sorting domain-containing protein n=1 Tax=Roseofilum halophilum BLCC-M91 TaxID=3022259 RepID=A0ABT7BS49_9CYAN|nr:hypothetical protein [Roseofilum halophilum]MDJ1181326.1 hypothetical protein [Roseofilum halophilum BLCC-M91]